MPRYHQNFARIFTLTTWNFQNFEFVKKIVLCGPRSVDTDKEVYYDDINERFGSKLTKYNFIQGV